MDVISITVTNLIEKEAERTVAASHVADSNLLELSTAITGNTDASFIVELLVSITGDVITTETTAQVTEEQHSQPQESIMEVSKSLADVDAAWRVKDVKHAVIGHKVSQLRICVETMLEELMMSLVDNVADELVCSDTILEIDHEQSNEARDLEPYESVHHSVETAVGLDVISITVTNLIEELSLIHI